MKPVRVTGYLDYNLEQHVEKYKDGEKGVEVITPFYTHVNKKDEACGILINRGWLPEDLKKFRYDRNQGTVSFEGILYRGDASTKYSRPNSVVNSEFKSVKPEEHAILARLGNEEEASQFMLKVVDFQSEARTTFPDVVSKEDLSSKLGIPAERHEAYEKLWNGVTFFGVVANTAIWLYL